MGGLGSGRRRGAKLTTDQTCSLDVRHLQRAGLLEPHRCFCVALTRCGRNIATMALVPGPDMLVVTNIRPALDDPPSQKSYSVMLSSTPCAYGGHRPWFHCPAGACGRRVAKLYFGASEILACRHCYQLAYVCQREAADFRAMRRADAIRALLGWRPGILNGHGDKPWGMHTANFENLVAHHDILVGIVLDGQARWAERLEKK